MTELETTPPATARSGSLSGHTLVDLLCDPSAVVAVGASAQESKLSSRALGFLLRHGYRGGLYAVHPRLDAVLGVPAVPSPADLPELTDAAAIVNLPARLVPQAIADLDLAGIDAAVVIGSGFESPRSGPRTELLEVMSQPGFRMRVIGPNCVGTMSTSSGAHLNFSTVLTRGPVRPGRIGLVTQSGALGNGLLMSLLRRGAGIAHWFSTGDELDTGALELTTGMLARSDVDSVGLFLEGLTDEAWLERAAATAAELGKQVFVLKAARTAAGRAAAGGHTGRLVGLNDATTAVLQEAGFVEVPDLAALADCLILRETCGPTRPRPAIGIVSVSGASGVVGADRVHDSHSLRLGVAGADRLGSLDTRLAAGNPLDVPFLDDTVTFTSAVAAFRTAGLFDVVVAVASSLAHDPDRLVADLAAAPGAAPLVLCHLSEDDRLDEESAARLARAGVAVAPTVERAISALDLTSRAGSPAAPVAAQAHPAEPEDLVGLEAARAMLPELPWVEWKELTSVDDARRFGVPAVLKAAGRRIEHRTELGAVGVVTDPAGLDEVYEQVAAACRDHGDAILAQRLAPPGGTELLVAATSHPEVGPFALVRMGGVFTELMPGQLILARRWDEPTRRRRLLESDVGRICAGYRGRPSLDVHALLAVVGALLDRIAEGECSYLELNPLFLYESGAVAVDAVGGRTPAHREM